jgi:uncharacterized protein with GYD domain
LRIAIRQRGIRDPSRSGAPKRVEAEKKAAKEAGVTIKEVLWVQGEYDFAAITEANDEIAATAFGLNIANKVTSGR